MKTLELRRALSFDSLTAKDTDYDLVPPAHDGGRYAIVRTRSAGVFAGWVTSRVGQEVVVREARRLWRWSGAASLSQLGVDGTNDPANCKFPVPVREMWLPEAIEIIWCTNKAKSSIEGVSEWHV